MQKIFLFFLILFCIFNVAYAEQDWGSNIIDIVVDIGNNITKDNYVNYKFLALREAIYEYVKPMNYKKKQEFSNKIITKVVTGINEQDIFYLNEVLLFLQINMRRFNKIYYIIP